ncbi:hypothetical protein BZG02_18880 [Labilibaculum filiforme]|uniref:Lipoprotein n=1 Tax=Labilibaculum filiforme TaxID=1940526 RepID=A0A2N3HR58_9BACT|nr:hypothetical protein [Labilibaculum filiforme]PKQ60530.1 hypothetical protein BZG02_18880 [Labilibaculum filiforme]
MKRNIVAVGVLLFFSTVLFSCSDSSDNNQEKDLTLEQSLKEKTVSLSNAVNEITSSKGFGIVTMNEPATKTGSEEEGDDTKFSANITLDDVKGVYEYSPAIPEETSANKMYFQTKFTKTGDSEKFIVKLPKEKAGNPWNLYLEEEGDEALVNDFVITTSQYNYSFSADQGFSFNYLLNSAIEVAGEDAGELYVDWAIASNQNFKYESKYSFTDTYSVGVEFSHGDTLSYSYNLKKGEDVLFKEEVEFAKGDGENRGSFEYALSIGIIKIVKNSENDDYQVYRDGTLEEDAVIEVVQATAETEESELAFCKKGLDLKITFADESVVVLSELLGQDTLDKMAEIFSSMYDMYFVNHVVNKVAHEAYYMNQSAS